MRLTLIMFARKAIFAPSNRVAIGGNPQFLCDALKLDAQAYFGVH
jgi:hypothetical protein